MNNNSSLKCVRDIREIPPTAYRLDTDGRQQRRMCERRQRLMWLLASYADGDGTRAFPSATTLASALGVSRRAVFYLLDDLKALGFIENAGYHGESGPRIRTIKIAAIQAAAGVQSSTSGVQASIKQECKLGGAGVQTTKAGVQASTSGVQTTIAHNRHLAATETANTQTDQAASAGKTIGALPEWVGLLFSEFNNHAPLQLRKIDRDGFMAAITQHGEAAIQLAWQHFIRVGTYNTETKYPAYLFFNDLPTYIKAAREKMQSHSWRAENDPQYAANIEASIRRQMNDDWERMKRAPKPENGAACFAYMDDEYLRQLAKEGVQEAVQELCARRSANDPNTVAAFPTTPVKVSQTSLEAFLATD